MTKLCIICTGSFEDKTRSKTKRLCDSIACKAKYEVRRVAAWRAEHREAYNRYMREYKERRAYAASQELAYKKERS